MCGIIIARAAKGCPIQLGIKACMIHSSAYQSHIILNSYNTSPSENMMGTMQYTCLSSVKRATDLLLPLLPARSELLEARDPPLAPPDAAINKILVRAKLHRFTWNHVHHHVESALSLRHILPILFLLLLIFKGSSRIHN